MIEINEKIKELLRNRGIGEVDLEEYLSLSPKRTYDPFLLLNMREGVDLILGSLKKRERICIYGDYDADGVTSTVIMTEFLKKLTEDVFYYIPSRFDEGYGLNKDAIKHIYDLGAQLIITVDCGSVSVDEVEYAKSLGLKIVVTDHHRINGKKADCILINPSQEECNYPFKKLSGCGVAFKLIQAICNELNLPKEFKTDALDLVAIGTIGDVVPLIDENRTLVKYGLKWINKKKRESLRMLIERLPKVDYPITSEKISFNIVPHINACGRMESATKAVEVLLREGDISEGINQVINLNLQRRELQNQLIERATQIVESQYENRNILVIHLSDVNEGIMGIVAGNLKERFKKPAIMLSDTEDNCLKGSGRSVENVDLYKLLDKNAHLFERFGGHPAACGFTIKKDNLPQLKKNLAEQMEELYDDEDKIGELPDDIEIDFDDLNMDFMKDLSLIEPVGKGNEAPIFILKGTVVSERNLGEESRFKSFRLRPYRSDLKYINCICFNLNEEIDDAIKVGNRVSVFGNLTINSWNGNDTIQMRVVTATEENHI